MKREIVTAINSPILTLNRGSSSLKFALFVAAAPFRRIAGGGIDRIGLPGTTLRVKDFEKEEDFSKDLGGAKQAEALNFLMDWIEARVGPSELAAVGHRVVHGGPKYNQPEKITGELLGELKRIQDYDPDHLPGEIELIEFVHRRHPQTPQIACFDTAFHHAMPRVARMLPIPRRYEAKGLRRYGFHGLSYAYLIEELEQLAGASAAQGRVIMAHLGSGASLAALKDGKSLDTTMGFTPASGLVMGTRSGDLDPGVAAFLQAHEGMSARQFEQMVNHESGLLGVSETSSDMRDLIAREKQDVRAAEAVELFCYQVKKGIGAYAALLGGLDNLVFAGGIGENVPEVRSRICGGLDFFGIELDPSRNQENAGIISAASGQVTVRVIPTDEEIMIARSACRLLGLGA